LIVKNIPRHTRAIIANVLQRLERSAYTVVKMGGGLNPRTAKALSLLNGELSKFIGSNQRRVLASNLRGEESDAFCDMIEELADRIRKMPKIYAQEKKGNNAIAYLHYFARGSMNWWITERGPDEFFGLADLYGDGGELGYISPSELTSNNVEIDLYWTPKPLSQVRH
jgi:hypothetical protein